MFNSFKLKLVAYFVVLSILPMAAAFWGFTSVAGVSKTRQVDLRLQAGLRAALAGYQERVDLDQSAAERLARARAFQLALERRDRVQIERLLRETPDISVRAPGGFALGGTPALAVRRSVDVVTRTGRIGTVVAALPLDVALVASLRADAGLGSSDVLALLHGSRIVASAPFVRGRVTLPPGRTATVGVGSRRYRVLLAPALAGGSGATLAVLSPQSLIDAADAAARDRLLLGLLACLAVVSLVAYLEGRSIVRTLRALAQAAHGIARGRLSERAPVRGRDEFAVLGSAFNEMAGQLEARVAELDSERRRLAVAITRFGEVLAATHDADQLLSVVVETAVEATRARGARLSLDGGATVESGDADAAGERLEIALTAGGEPLGRLVVVGSFDDEQRRAVASLGSQAAVALENVRLHRLVERQALVDGLTGLANRRRCEEALHLEIARADRLGTALSLVLADLDDFKEVNDAHGHAAGDEVLREFADVIRATVRESDVAGRWGGEEFLLLLPGTEGVGAAQLAERIRLALTARLFADGAGGSFDVTCSFGVAEHSAAGDAAALFAAVDRALYRAKRAGKDRVERAVRVGSP